MKQLSLFAVLVVLVLMLLPFGRVAVWDGRFPLAITIDADPSLDVRDFSFATCWSESEADHAMKTGPAGEVRFRPSDSQGDGTYTVAVPCSGRSGPYGIDYSYHQPSFLIIQYTSTAGGEALAHRKRFNIPTGRGPRSMHALVP